jgi:hypothetical protein
MQHIDFRLLFQERFIQEYGLVKITYVEKVPSFSLENWSVK